MGTIMSCSLIKLEKYYLYLPFFEVSLNLLVRQFKLCMSLTIVEDEQKQWICTSLLILTFVPKFESAYELVLL